MTVGVIYEYEEEYEFYTQIIWNCTKLCDYKTQNYLKFTTMATVQKRVKHLMQECNVLMQIRKKYM